MFEQTFFTFCFSVFIAVFDNQANICCSSGSIAMSIPSHDHNARDQEIQMDRYQDHFKKLGNFFSKTQQSAVSRACFKKAGWMNAWDIKKGPYFGNFRTIQRWKLLKQHANLKILECEIVKVK